MARMMNHRRLGLKAEEQAGGGSPQTTSGSINLPRILNVALYCWLLADAGTTPDVQFQTFSGFHPRRSSNPLFRCFVRHRSALVRTGCRARRKSSSRPSPPSRSRIRRAHPSRSRMPHHTDIRSCRTPSRLSVPVSLLRSSCGCRCFVVGSLGRAAGMGVSPCGCYRLPVFVEHRTDAGSDPTTTMSVGFKTSNIVTCFPDVLIGEPRRNGHPSSRPAHPFSTSLSVRPWL